MDRVSVVICTHAIDRLPLTRKAVASIAEQTFPAHELIVVVDHNTDLLRQIRAENPAIKIIANTCETGLSGARNCGVLAASGDIVAFIDDDAQASSDWLETLVRHYQDRHVLAVGGHIEPIWPTGRPSWWPEEFDWVIGCSYRGQPEAIAPVRNLIGCNMSFRRAVFDICGGFATELGRVGADAAGCEETELCIRAQTAFPLGHIVYDPAVRVSHSIEPRRTKWSYFAKRCRAEGRSKAALSAKTGTGRGLKSERDYVRRTLPTGVLKGLFGGPGALRKSGAIIAGFGMTAGAFLGARLRRTKVPATHASPLFAPFKITEFDMSEPNGDLAGTDPETGKVYGAAFCLIRDHGTPVGIATLPLCGTTIPANELGPLLEQARAKPHQTAKAKIVEQLPSARVVIATRDRPEMLANCLDTLLAQAYPEFEIHVVDSAPATSATRELIAQKYADTDIRYRHEPLPGLGLAHNRGIAGARTDVLAFTDDDVLIDHNWLHVIGTAFGRDRRIGCVTGLILPAELETRAQYWIEAHGGFSKGFAPKLFDLKDHRPQSPLFPYAAGAFGSGANMAFSRAALDAIGGFDPALGAGTIARGGDDLAAFTAVILARFQLAYEPGAIVWHHHRRNEAGIAGQAHGYGVGLGAYLTKTLLDRPQAALAYATGFPAALAHILGSGSEKNTRLPADYPASLKWAERRGMLAGFAAYFRSRKQVARSAEREYARTSISGHQV